MVTLLADWKRCIRTVDQRDPTMEDFRRAWDRSWEIIVLEKGWAHNTPLRRAMRQIQDETKEECAAAFIDVPTPFSFAAHRLSEVAGGMCLRLEPEQIGKALLAAIAYVELPADDLALSIAAANAANRFVNAEREAVAA
jgi:hypothetical protein